MIEKIKKELLAQQDRKYKDFSTSLLPGVNNVIGVRLPILRQMARDIAKNNYIEFFSKNNDEYLELTMLEAMVIGNLKLEFDEVIRYIENFIPKINCWSVCDSFCTSLKIINKNKEKMKIFLEKYFRSDLEYELRFGFVVALFYFDYEYIMDKIYKFNNDTYYAKMAAAWALSICFVKDFDRCFNDIKKHKIHPWVLTKGLTKARESYRLTKEQKDKLKVAKNELLLYN